MAQFRIVYQDGSVAKNTKVQVSFNGGGMKTGFTDSRGDVTISGSSTYGKIFVRGREVHSGSLNIGEVKI
ncbi:hypothetical protein GSY74_03450 [Sulfurovum sp. bin170]|uniref:hypothetical protein n=1 Tax=Sulfurovum sp. bin170 TaxID=2695268 RepID=UPI0013DF55BA|nr:hypothetical protein [Sulfurovum sp. bin170]NEW60329.1 hypothetical protein [Sulfurovum sp. bin170]